MKSPIFIIALLGMLPSLALAIASIFGVSAIGIRSLGTSIPRSPQPEFLSYLPTQAGALEFNFGKWPAVFTILGSALVVGGLFFMIPSKKDQLLVWTRADAIQTFLADATKTSSQYNFLFIEVDPFSGVGMRKRQRECECEIVINKMRRPEFESPIRSFIASSKLKVVRESTDDNQCLRFVVILPEHEWNQWAFVLKVLSEGFLSRDQARVKCGALRL